MKTSERLTMALEFLKENRWTQFFTKTGIRMEGGGYGYCAEGCIRYGAFPELVAERPGSEPVGLEVARLIEFMDVQARQMAAEKNLSFGHGGPVLELYEFNDLATTRKEDVIALFERAIQEAKKEEEEAA